MSVRNREPPSRGPITISPTSVALEAGNWQAASSFNVKNDTGQILYQIRVKLTIDHPHIRIQDCTIEPQNPTDAPQTEIGQIGEESEGKKAMYLVIKRLNPGEIWHFTITKCSPYIPSTKPILYATILSFDEEPAPA